MSDHEASKPQPDENVDGLVDSADAALADAAKAADAASSDAAAAGEAAKDAAAAAEGAAASAKDAATDAAQAGVDADAAAFAEAEAAFPGTFGSAEPPTAKTTVFDAPAKTPSPESTAETSVLAESAYAPPAASDAETRVLAPEPVAEQTFGAPANAGPIFVQAPEPPRERGNHGAIAGIGILAALCFAVLYLGVGVGLAALAGEIDGESFVESLVASLTSWTLWVPTVIFYLAFCLLGAFINRGRWGFWVIFGILVGFASWGGHLLGQLFEAPFWNITPTEGAELVSAHVLTPLAIAALIAGRELTIWFGAWAARSGARKTARNAEDQREYEKLLEAGPTLSR